MSKWKRLIVWLNWKQAVKEQVMHLRLLSTITLAGMLTLAIAGCGSEETASQTTASNTEVKRSPSVQPTAATQQIAQKPAPETAVDQPMAAQTSQNQGSSTAGLIQPTNVNQRTKQVQTGRSDPFAGLFTIPKVSVVPKPKKYLYPLYLNRQLHHL